MARIILGLVLLAYPCVKVAACALLEQGLVQFNDRYRFDALAALPYPALLFGLPGLALVVWGVLARTRGGAEGKAGQQKTTTARRGGRGRLLVGAASVWVVVGLIYTVSAIDTLLDESVMAWVEWPFGFIKSRQLEPDPDPPHVNHIGDPELGPPGGDTIPPGVGMPGIVFTQAVRSLGVEFGAWRWKRGQARTLLCTVKPTAWPLEWGPKEAWRRLSVAFYDHEERRLEGGGLRHPELEVGEVGRLEVVVPEGTAWVVLSAG